jgi:hypothetical protein
MSQISPRVQSRIVRRRDRARPTTPRGTCSRAIRGPARPSFPSCARAAPSTPIMPPVRGTRPRRMLVRPRRRPCVGAFDVELISSRDAPPDISRHALPGPRPDSRDPPPVSSPALWGAVTVSDGNSLLPRIVARRPRDRPEMVAEIAHEHAPRPVFGRPRKGRHRGGCASRSSGRSASESGRAREAPWHPEAPGPT